MEIRNFVIIAHVDHGKSTLADRFLELTGSVEPRKMREQYLDIHPLERERGITIKMQPVRMIWRMPNHPHLEKNQPSSKNQAPSSSNSKQEFVLNLIDTPGHADFSYEVSRALAAVEGAILLVDATQGVQAQTLSNLHLAQKQGLVIIPAVNKIDLSSAATDECAAALGELCGVLPETVLRISAKEGTGVEILLHTVAARVPPPYGACKRLKGLNVATSAELLRALIFDSAYDSYRGVIAHVRVMEGVLRKGDRLSFMASKAACEAEEVGVFVPELVPVKELGPGEIGYVMTGFKEPEKVRVGDTIAHAQFKRLNALNIAALSGYREPEPVVFASVFPERQDDYGRLRESLNRLKLEDSALSFEPEESAVLGRGMRIGFLGLLHIEIVAERLKREYGLTLIFSHPSVAFRVKKRGGTDYLLIHSAGKMPESHEIEMLEEPWARLEIVTPPQFLGAVTSLLGDRRGFLTQTLTLPGERLLLGGEAPLREIITDFYDALKSVSRGFASLFYTLAGYRPADLIRLEILVAGEQVPAFAQMLPREDAARIGRMRVEQLRSFMARELFPVSLQAMVEGRVIARETIPALKKDVTGYLYGGDRTRKMKLWKKQQRGKKKLKEMGHVEIPPEVFLKMMRQ